MCNWYLPDFDSLKVGMETPIGIVKGIEGPFVEIENFGGVWKMEIRPNQPGIYLVEVPSTPVCQSCG